MIFCIIDDILSAFVSLKILIQWDNHALIQLSTNFLSGPLSILYSANILPMNISKVTW